MDAKLVTHEQEVATNEQSEVLSMELTKAQELIKTLKEVKAKNEITYPRIMDRLEKNIIVMMQTVFLRVVSSLKMP